VVNCNELIFAIRQISRVPLWLELNAIQRLYTKCVATLPSEEQKAVTLDMISELSELTREGVIFQGAALRCPNCMSSYWYSIEEMRRSYHLPWLSCFVSITSRNTLVVSAERTHQSRGCRSRLAAGFANSRETLRAKDCFFFIPSVEFLTYTDGDKLRLEQELDLAWIKDGSFGIAEIKTTSKLFKRSDYEALIELASIVKPDIILIATPDGSSNEMVAGKKMIEEKLNNGVLRNSSVLQCRHLFKDSD
jgi:hypothetical protein